MKKSSKIGVVIALSLGLSACGQSVLECADDETKQLVKDIANQQRPDVFPIIDNQIVRAEDRVGYAKKILQETIDDKKDADEKLQKLIVINEVLGLPANNRDEDLIFSLLNQNPDKKIELSELLTFDVDSVAHIFLLNVPLGFWISTIEFAEGYRNEDTIAEDKNAVADAETVLQKTRALLGQLNAGKFSLSTIRTVNENEKTGARACGASLIFTAEYGTFDTDISYTLTPLDEGGFLGKVHGVRDASFGF